MKLRHALIALLGAGVVDVGGCAATSESQHTGAGGMGGDIPPSSSSSGGGGSGCLPHCSADLRSVVGCDGEVIATCPPHQDCSDGACATACESARQNRSSIGCDYYAVEPDIVAGGRGGCFAAFIVNTWDEPVSIQVERAGQMFDAAGFSYLAKGSGQSLAYEPIPNGQLPPGEVAIVFLSALSGGQSTPCPAGVNVAYGNDAAAHGTALGDAFHITTSAPTVAYDIYPYGGGQSAATSATLLLPASAWDTNYIAVDAFRKSTSVPEGQPSLDIVAAEDGTQITISPNAAIVGGPGVPGTGKGQPITYNLDKGQVLQITQDAELIGSPIQSNKPIGVWGAASCLTIDVDKAACDSAHQQIPPVKALGHEYVAVRYRNRFDGQEESPPWRIVGAVDGTVLSYEPSQPNGAPTTLDSGTVAEFRAPGPFLVRSQDGQHPFYMSAHMTGWEEVDPSGLDKRGDAEFVNIIPGDQYLSSYVFFTDPTYPETNLVVVRKNMGAGFEDVILDCAGALTGWQPVGSSGLYEYTRIDLLRHDFQPQGSCDNGRHEVHSDAPFGLVVWGWGTAETGGYFGAPGAGGFYSQAVSYAYPAGASVQPINTVVVPPK